MPYEYREKFEKDGGFRLFRDRTSVLLRAFSYGRRFSDQQNVRLAQRLDTFMDAVDHYVQDAPARNLEKVPSAGAPLSKVDFSEVDPTPMYKYVSDDTWDYLRSGSFQFGTAEYYRTSPNIDIQDRREGAGHFHLTFGNNQLNVSLVSGYNCAIFCGTSQIDGPNDGLMRQRFGRKRIKIDPVSEFMARARKCIGAYRSRIYDVVYRDIQSYTEEFPHLENILEITNRDKLTKAALRKLNKEFFRTFYEYGLMPGLYAKPTKYSDERERRLIFETRKDTRMKPIIVRDKRLLDFITFLGE